MQGEGGQPENFIYILYLYFLLICSKKASSDVSKPNLQKCEEDIDPFHNKGASVRVLKTLENRKDFEEIEFEAVFFYHFLQNYKILVKTSSAASW